VATLPSLGRLAVVRPREVWPDEARDFTPWLLENADVLSQLLGMELVLDVAEHPVGGFSLDLIGRDETTGRTVIVENQLEESDHRHLGQILTYAAGTDPTTIVWVAASFRPEHRAALDWLNERTNEETRFFGVEIEVVRILDSVPAPAFKLIAQPNDWGKQVRAATQAAGTSERAQLYAEFWLKFSATLKSRHPTWTRGTTSKSSWFAMSAGSPGANWVFTFGAEGLSVQIEFVADAETNTQRFERLLALRPELEASFGGPLTWDAVEGRKATKVAARTDVAVVTERERWDEWIEWMISTAERLRAAVESVGGPVGT
jgi:hypothetical protein